MNLCATFSFYLCYKTTANVVTIVSPSSTNINCCTAVGQNIQLPWQQRDFDGTIGQYLVSDENSVCWIPIKHNTLPDADLQVCHTIVSCV